MLVVLHEELVFQHRLGKFFVEHRKDLNKVAFAPALWRQLSSDDRAMLVELCEEQVAVYYEKRVSKGK